MNLRVDAWTGDDVVAVSATLADESEGKVRPRVQGGNGGDDLTLEIITALDDNSVDALLDGGRGFDTCDATPNVEVRNCED